MYINKCAALVVAADKENIEIQRDLKSMLIENDTGNIK